MGQRAHDDSATVELCCRHFIGHSVHDRHDSFERFDGLLPLCVWMIVGSKDSTVEARWVLQFRNIVVVGAPRRDLPPVGSAEHSVELAIA